MKSINPATNDIILEYEDHSPSEVKDIIENVHTQWLAWKETSFAQRSELFRRLAHLLRERKDKYSRLITEEMGKIIRESQAEVLKCANVCDYYADNAAGFLSDEIVATDASRSLVVYQPLGVVFAVMPWNFPFWQVFRFAVPALMAGNGAVLKHASNVPGCALAIEESFRDAGFPSNIFRTLMIPSREVTGVISNNHIVAVSLTGSEAAGSEVAASAGRHIKKTVLELGGSDAFIILEDADMEAAVKTAVAARMINQGQSCIAAKRFIVVKSRAAEFETKIKLVFEGLRSGDPMDPLTDVGPLARIDILGDLDRQVQKSISAGARCILGGKSGKGPGAYYQPTILTDVTAGMPVYSEETFGPVVAVIPVENEQQAVEVANDSSFGLGGSVWTNDRKRGEAVARKIATGAMFVNGLVKSDPRLPFGGIRKSGYGRELGQAGIREFVNVKSIWIG